MPDLRWLSIPAKLLLFPYFFLFSLGLVVLIPTARRSRRWFNPFAWVVLVPLFELALVTAFDLAFPSPAYRAARMSVVPPSALAPFLLLCLWLFLPTLDRTRGRMVSSMALLGLTIGVYSAVTSNPSLARGPDISNALLSLEFTLPLLGALILPRVLLPFLGPGAMTFAAQPGAVAAEHQPS